MNIDYSPEFVHRFRKLPKAVRIKAIEKEKIFRKNQFDSRLKTHKLSGKLNGYYYFWVDFQTRIIFSFTNTNRQLVHFHSISGHDIYK